MNVEYAVIVRIQGRVQGVGFRDWTLQEARMRGLSGYVRNCSDGTVEALFSGPYSSVQDMITACRRGPSWAMVMGVHERQATPPEEPGFRKLSSY